MERYNRQTILQEFGEAGQRALKNASVLVIGAGGLGCPVLLYLNAMGMGRIGIMDGDQVQISNLHRQVLFGEGDLGKNKAVTAAKALNTNNSQTQIDVFQENITKENAVNIVFEYDIVVDCSDNFPTRYLVNDICFLMNKPLVFAAINGFEGQVAVFNWKSSGNYRDLYPIMPVFGEVANCEETGVLGVLAGIIGSIQAAEVIKIITGIGQPIAGSILNYDLRDHSQIQFKYKINPSTSPSWENFRHSDYAEICELPQTQLIDLPAWEKIVENESMTIIDVRNHDEKPKLKIKHLSLPLPELKKQFHMLPLGDILFICQTGKRSREAVVIAQSKDEGTRKFFTLQGGINALRQLN